MKAGVITTSVYDDVMAQVRTKALKCSNEEMLVEIAKMYRNDYRTMQALLRNASITEAVQEEVAKSDVVHVRRILTQRGEHISSVKVQNRLAFDKDWQVKLNLARTTNLEQIKKLIFRNTPENPANEHNEQIRGVCLKRMSSLELIERFILTNSNSLYRYGYYILSNQSLTTSLINMFVTLSPKLDETLVKMIREHPNYNESVEETLNRYHK